MNAERLFQTALTFTLALVAGLVIHASTVFADELPLRVESVVLRPLREAEVPAQQTGLLAEIAVFEGQQVKQGEVLAALDDRAARLDVEIAKTEQAQAKAKAGNVLRIEYAKKALEVAQAELRRSSESIEKFAKSVSDSQLDVERLTVEKLILDRKQAEHDQTIERFGFQLTQHELEAAQLRLEQHQLRAPFDGIVVLVRGRVGEWVEFGTPVMRLVAVDKLRAEGFLPADEAEQHLLGQRVRFIVKRSGRQLTDASANEAFGRLAFISPEVDAVTRQVRVWAEIDNSAGRLRPGEQGVLEIVPGPSAADAPREASR